jgi:hypothetical protein
MLASLIREAEEGEKEECACDQRPARQIEAESEKGNLLPDGGWDLDDSRVVAAIVCFCPAFPRPRMLFHQAVEYIRRQRNGKKYIDAGKGHQAEIPTTIEVPVG